MEHIFDRLHPSCAILHNNIIHYRLDAVAALFDVPATDYLAQATHIDNTAYITLRDIHDIVDDNFLSDEAIIIKRQLSHYAVGDWGRLEGVAAGFAAAEGVVIVVLKRGNLLGAIRDLGVRRRPLFVTHPTGRISREPGAYDANMNVLHSMARHEGTIPTYHEHPDGGAYVSLTSATMRHIIVHSFTAGRLIANHLGG